MQEREAPTMCLSDICSKIAGLGWSRNLTENGTTNIFENHSPKLEIWCGLGRRRFISELLSWGETAVPSRKAGHSERDYRPGTTLVLAVAFRK